MNTLYTVLACVFLLIILSFFRSKRAKSRVVRVVDDKCTGCRRCLKICRHRALEIVDDETAPHIFVKYPKKCTACGKCIAVCKFEALELVDRK